MNGPRSTFMSPETEGDILETEGDILETEGDILETEGDIVETEGDIMETLVTFWRLSLLSPKCFHVLKFLSLKYNKELKTLDRFSDNTSNFCLIFL
jgi:hypothetical protein